MSLQETIASETDCRQTGVLISVGGVCISDGSVFRFRMEVFPFRIGVFSNLDWGVLVSEGGVTILDEVFCFWMGVFRFWMIFLYFEWRCFDFNNNNNNNRLFVSALYMTMYL